VKGIGDVDFNAVKKVAGVITLRGSRSDSLTRFDSPRIWDYTLQRKFNFAPGYF
jgi:hypothetical protein